MSVSQAARRWDISERRVRILCAEGRIDGVIRSGWAWNIPVDAPKPADGRRLRHLKNLELRFGTLNFSRLEALHASLSSMRGEREGFLADYGQVVLRVVGNAFACEGIFSTDDRLSALFSGSFVPDMEQKHQLLALNFRSILLRTALNVGLGPLAGNRQGPRGRFSEQRLSLLYCTLLQGIDDLDMGAYRQASIPPANPPANDNRLFPVSLQMETMMSQYEHEWSPFNPLVRAAFLYGELLRIRPFASYCWVFATLVLCLELLEGGYPPTMVDRSHLNEFKASLMLTRKRGNYANVMRLLEQSLVFEFYYLLQKETFDGV